MLQSFWAKRDLKWTQNKVFQIPSTIAAWNFSDFLHEIIVAYPAGIYLPAQINNRSTRTRCEICSKLTIKAPEQRQWRRSGVFIGNFEHISHLVRVSIVNFEHVITGWIKF